LLIFLSGIPLQIPKVYANPDSEQKVWVYTYQTNSYQNQGIDFFFDDWFHINYERTTNVNDLGDNIVIIMGSNMSSAPSGLEDKIKSASFTALFTCGITYNSADKNGSCDVPSEIKTLFGVKYGENDALYESRQLYGSCRTVAGLLDTQGSYRWNMSAVNWRHINPETSIAETVIEVWGNAGRSNAAVIALKNRTRFYSILPIWTRTSDATNQTQKISFETLFTPKSELSPRFPARQDVLAFEVPVVYWILQYAIALPTITPYGYDASYVHRADDFGYEQSYIDDVNDWVQLSGINVSMTHITKFNASDMIGNLTQSVSYGNDWLSHGKTHAGATYKYVSNGTNVSLFDSEIQRKFYAINKTGDANWDFWVDYDQDDVVDDDEWCEPDAYIWQDLVAGGDWIFFNQWNGTKVEYTWQIKPCSSSEFYGNLTDQQDILQWSWEVGQQQGNYSNFLGHASGGGRHTNITLQAMENVGFKYIVDNLHSNFPYPFSRDANLNLYPNVFTLPMTSTTAFDGSHPWGTYVPYLSEADANKSYGLSLLDGGVVVNIYHFGSKMGDTYRWIIGNFTEKQNVYVTTYADLYWKTYVFSKMRVQTYPNYFLVDLGRLTPAERLNYADGMAIKFQNKTMQINVDASGELYFWDGNNFNITSSSYTSDQLTLNVDGTSGQTSYVVVYVGSKGKPKSIDGVSSWEYDETNNVSILNVLSQSVVRIEWRTLGDIDGDGDVDRYDLGIFAGVYGTSEGDSNYMPEVDLDNDGDIDIYDLGILALNY